MKHKNVVLIFCTNLSQILIILTRTELDMIINTLSSSCKLLVILVKFNEI